MPDFGESPVPDLPSLRRAVPKFSRDSIDLSRPQLKREWQEIKVQEISAGDTVVGLGMIVSSGPTIPGAYNSVSGVLIENVMGEVFALSPSEIVKAFVVAKDQ